MGIVISHIVRLMIDLVLLYIMLGLEIYELTSTVKILVTGQDNYWAWWADMAVYSKFIRRYRRMRRRSTC